MQLAPHILAQEKSTLALIDWIVLLLYAGVMLAVGVFYGRRAKTAEEYHLGGRTMRPWAVGLSLFATLLSTVSYLAVPSEMIHRGPMVLFGMAAYPLIIFLVGWVLIPRIMRFRVTTAYEILEHRLGRSARVIGSSIFVAMRLLWMAVIIYATADKVLVPLAGLSDRATPWVCLALGGITLVYTSLGGLRAVVWTDVLQSFIMFFGAIACIVVISYKLGGMSAWWPTQWAAHWEPFRVLPDGSSGLSLLDMSASVLIWYVCTAGSDQMAVQRYLATRDAPAARRAFIINMVADVLVLLLCAAVGFALLGYFMKFPGSFGAAVDVKTHADQLFPRFIVAGLPAGVTGIVVAGLLAAAMSSLSSGMSSVTSVISVDFIGAFRRAELSPQRQLNLTRIVSVIVGGVVVLLSFLYVGKVQGHLLEVANKVVNLLTAPLFVLFIMALFVPWATGTGTIIGAAAASVAALLVAYWNELTGRGAFGFTWIMPASLILGVAVASLASLLLGRRILNTNDSETRAVAGARLGGELT